MNDFNTNIIEEFRNNKGKVAGPFQGMPMVILTTKGRRTGKPHETPLVPLEDDGKLFVFGSMGGAPKHPAWFLNLRDNPDVAIDHANRVIRLRIPPAKLIAVEIRDMQTYDERGGLWNPFTREDRDAIQRQARAQLTAAGSQLELLRHANESAIELLRMLLAKNGYAVDVALRGT